MRNNDLIFKFLNSLEDSLRRIRSMDFTFDMVLGDEDIQDMLDRRMQKAIEACIDIVIHLSMQLKLPRQEKTSELFNLLSKKKIIDSKLANKLKSAVGLRNIIVHEYTEVDYKLAYSDLDSKLKDLEKFAYEIKKFLDKNN